MEKQAVSYLGLFVYHCIILLKVTEIYLYDISRLFWLILAIILARLSPIWIGDVKGLPAKNLVSYSALQF